MYSIAMIIFNSGPKNRWCKFHFLVTVGHSHRRRATAFQKDGTHFIHPGGFRILT